MKQSNELDYRAPLRHRMKNLCKPYLYLLPSLVLLVIWVYRPLTSTSVLAFQKWGMVPGTTPVFVGLDNFIRLFQSKDFLVSIGNTVFYTLGLLPFLVIIPLLLAVVTHDMTGRLKNVYRALFFVPMILAPVTVSAVWRWLLHPANGLVNDVLLNTGVIDKNISFFSDPAWAKWIILLMTGWGFVGFGAIMFSAALTAINKEYYEAAALDGTGKFKQFFDLSLPLLSPTILLMTTISVLFASQMTFAYIDILTHGGPFGTSTNIYYEIYKYGFSNFNAGLSSAASLIFFILFTFVALGLNYLTKRFAFYDN